MDSASLLCAHEYRENGCKFADPIILRQIARYYKGRRFYNKIHGQRSNYQEDYRNWWEIE